MLKKVCIVTGSRAEYGLLRPVIKKLSKENIDLKVVVTGMHLSKEFGNTFREIEKDGIKIDKKIEILVSSDTASGNCTSMGLALIKFGEYFEEEKPDLLLVLGDRYEIAAVSLAGTINNIPIAHMHGGELTEGAYDDALRHSITKMSTLHFASTSEYRKRIIQLGESKERVKNVGAIGVENIEKLKLVSLKEIEEFLNFKLDKKFALVTFHPVTLKDGSGIEEVLELLKVINDFKEYKFIITKANADKEGIEINKLLEKFEKENAKRIKLVSSMGVINYLSSMKYAEAVIGNSSSGIIEAPSFNIPTVNIGDRQKGRVQSKTTINCKPNYLEIKKAFNKAFSKEFKEECKTYQNPYKKEGTSDSVVKEIMNYLDEKDKQLKRFYDINWSDKDV